MNELIEEMNKENWKDVLQLENPQDAYNKFTEKFTNLYDKNLPIKKIKVNKKKQEDKPWITKGLKVSAKNKINYTKNT